MPFPISLEQPSYEALVALARKGTTTEGEKRALEAFLVSLETGAGITRYTLWVQWQELNQPLPPGTNFPERWPPQLRHQINQISRPIARVDVETLLASKARQPVEVKVTTDPAALIGWAKLDDYFIR